MWFQIFIDQKIYHGQYATRALRILFPPVPVVVILDLQYKKWTNQPRDMGKKKMGQSAAGLW